MLEKNRTYVIVCRDGRRKDECPLIIQKGWCCAECSQSGYILREHIDEPEENEEKKDD